MAKIPVTRMNFEAMENFGNKVFELAETIDQSIGNIHNEFRRVAESGNFAGSTLQAVSNALNPVLKVRETIWTRAVNARNDINTSIEEVKEAELQNEINLNEMLNVDPMAFEVPAEFNTTPDA